MSSTSKRLLAAVLCVLMTLGLFIPAGAAPATLGGQYAVVEVPVGDDHDHAEEAAPLAEETVEAPSVVGEEDVSASLLAVKVHDFTDSDTTSDFFTISGNLSTGKGKVTYEGKELTQCLKLESATSITFNATEAGTLTLVFVETAPTIKIDGTKVTGTSNIITQDLTAGAHTISKADTANLFYMSYGSNCDHAGTSYTVVKAATCTTKGEKKGTCPKCGNEVTEEIAIDPSAHVYKSSTSGICQECGKDSATGAVHTHTWGEWSVKTAASCTDEGVRTRTCTNADCGKTEEEPVAREPHSYTAEGVCENCGAKKTDDKFLKAAGHLESAYIEWSINTDYVGYNVYVIDAAGKETKLDDELIRQYPGFMRADALGLKAGNYKMKVVPVTKTGEDQTLAMTTGTLEVLAQDRSGYAFTGNDTPGAYKADGTLKDGAIVVYITEKTKDTVTIPGLVDSNKNVPVGIGAIVQAAYKKKDNTTPPICFRLIGNITDPANLGSGDLYVDGGASGPGKPNPCKGLTIEGVGNDAVCNGFGIVLKGASYTEIRNLGMMNCDSKEKDEIGLQQSNTYCWVHNCDIFYGNAGSDGDQAKGDGALDTKKSTGITHSYNHFWDCGKCNLQGMKDETTENCITYHHNWFDHSDSRHPRVRTCTVHVYNNYYDGNAKYGVGATLGSSIFVENNFFRSCKNPMMISLQGTDAKGDGTFSGENGGMIKAYGNHIEGASSFIPYTSGTDFDAYVAKTRDEKVPATVKASTGAVYSNFDTASNFYKYTPDSPEAARDKVIAYAGRVEGGDFQWTFVAADDADYSVNKELKAALMSYKTSLVSVGGTITGGAAAAEHTVANWSAWKVTTPATCSAYGVETRTCTYPGCTLHTAETRPVPPTAHTFVNGVCSVCKAKEGDTVAPPNNPSGGKGYVLKGSDFKMTKFDDTDKKKDALTAAELAKVAEGYFTMDGAVNKRISQPGEVGATTQFFDLSQGGSNGFKFTVAADEAPATVKASFSSSGSSNTSALVLQKADGTPVNNDKGAAYAAVKGTGKESVTFKDLPAGEYVVRGSQDGGAASDARLYDLTVTVAAAEQPDVPTVCDHTWGAWTVVRPATCGTDGWQERTCSKCGNKDGDEIDATGLHTWGEWSEADEDGILTRTCTVCGEEQTKAVGEPDPVDPTPTTTPVTKITISGSGTLTVGKSITLTATVKPDDATDKTVTWTSSDEKVATVDAKGKVTGVAAGTVTITATAKDGSGVKDTWSVSVSTASSPSSSSSGGGGGRKPSGGDEPTTEPVTTPATLPFVDVKSDDWFCDAVEKAFSKGLMKGIDATHFDPNTNTTRAMVATVLFRLDGEKKGDVHSAFADVASGVWYSDAIDWAAEKGVVAGDGKGNFAPNNNVTREQFALMLFRYANPTVLDKMDALGQFSDAASVSDWAAEAMQWAVKVGILNGKGNGTLDPQGLATRAQVCTMLIRFMELDK